MSDNKNKTTVVILALLLGFIGAHWFYLEKPVKGIIYIVASFFFIGFILAFIDFIVFLCMSDKTFSQKYLNTTSNKINSESKYDKLEKIGKLKESGILTQEEFEAEKNILLKNG